MSVEKRLPGDLGFGLIVGSLTMAFIFVSLSWALWQIPYPIRIDDYLAHLVGWLAMEINSHLPAILIGRGQAYYAYLQQLPQTIRPWMLTSRFHAALLVAAASGVLLGYQTAKGQPAEKHIAGRRLYQGKAGLKVLVLRSKTMVAKFGAGIRLHPSFSWLLSLDQEARHCLVWGSTGGGKTQILIPWIRAAIDRGDKLVIFDNKGDFTSWLPSSLILVAPWDARSVVWDIAKDCRNPQDAQELAARLIAEGNDPLWHQSARQVLTAVIVRLQHEQPGKWTWDSLYKSACSSQDELLETVKLYVPQARHLFESPGKTTQSVLINLGANLSIVGTLATAWGVAEPKRMFSFSEWLVKDSPKHRIIVLQGSGRYTELARAYLQSILTLMSSRINSPEFRDSRKRRLWFFLDEFPQLGELKDFSPLLEIGRSKGVRVVIGAQDIAQIKNLYGEHTASSWTSMVGTQIIVRVNAGETANTLAKEVIGTRTVDRIVRHKGASEAPHREHPMVVEPAQLSDDLGPRKIGVRAMVLGFGDVFVLDWPFAEIRKLRQSSVPAAWLKDTKNVMRSRPDDQQESREYTEAENLDRRPQPKLKLRPPSSAELFEMAAVSTTVTAAAEDFDDLFDTATGGTHEPR